MSQAPPQGTQLPAISLTAGQIELLQTQLKQFKSLGKRFADSSISKIPQSDIRQGAPQGVAPVPNPITSQTQAHPNALNPQPHMSLNSGGIAPRSEPSSSSQHTSQPIHPTSTSTQPGKLPLAQPAQPAKPSAPVPAPAPSPAPAPTPSLAPTSSSLSSQSALNQPPTPVLSWQCFYSLLLSGPQKPSEQMISIPSAEVGCFSKASSFPLIMTTPYVAMLREKMLSEHLASRVTADTSGGSAVPPVAPIASGAQSSEQPNGHSNSSNISRSASSNSSSKDQPSSSHIIPGNRQKEIKVADLVAFQRQERAAVAASYIRHCSQSAAAPLLHLAPSVGIGGYLLNLLSRKNYIRNRRINRRDVRTWEREEKKRRTDAEDKKKKKNIEFLKAITNHREDFIRFHKNKKSECAKTAKAVKAWTDLSESRRDREEARQEMRRIQALKENDMEAYSKLVQETKNERLHYLMNQTDSYLAAINAMVQNQRLESEATGSIPEDFEKKIISAPTGVEAIEVKVEQSGQSGVTGSSDVAAAQSSEQAGESNLLSATNKAQSLSKASKEYYETTHRKSEKVAQPTMLKGGDLKEYQMSGLQWMVSLYNNRLNGILADEMGLGKTIQTIALISYLIEFKKNNGPYMIVVPLSTLSNWVNELTKWAPEIRKVVYKGIPNLRKQLYKEEVEPGNFNLLLTTYEYIMKDKASLRKHIWQYIIVDEGHRMKNANSKFAQTLGTIYTSKNRLLLTGTPLQNNLPELWALLNFLLPSIFSSVDTFDQWFNKPFSSFKSPQASSANLNENGEGDAVNLSQEEKLLIVHRLHEVLRPFVLRREKIQVLDQLPEKVENVIRCELSGWQRKLYNVIQKRSLPLLQQLGNGLEEEMNGANGGGSGGLNNAIMQLRKVCNHPFLFLDEWFIDNDLIRSSGKFELLDRMLPKLKAGGHRVLMFSQMTHVMTILERYFEYRGFLHLRLDGSTSSEEREKRMFMFNDPDSPYFIFLLSTRAGGLGLNLATADTVILFDSDWNPMMDAQAQDRAHRIGQKNEVRVFRLITNSPVEERILAKATDKKNLNGLVVDAGKFNNQKPVNANNKGGNRDRQEMMETYLKELSNSTVHAGSGSISSMGLDSSRYAATATATASTNANANATATGVDGEEGEFEGEEGEALEDLIPNDEQINEMMTTNLTELALYKSIDDERIRWQKKMYGTNYKALMSETEQPAWLLPQHWTNKHTQLRDLMSDSGKANGSGKKKRKSSAITPTDEGYMNTYEIEEEDDNDGDGESNYNDVIMIGGRMMRKRKENVVYDDGLTDIQYARLMDKQLEEEEQKRNNSRPTLSIKRQSLASAGDSTASLSSLAASGVGGGSAPKKMKIEASDGAAAAAFNGSSLQANDFKRLIKIVNELSNVSKGLAEPYTYCKYSDLFSAKPDKKVYPDYYQVVSNPISLKEIKDKLKKQAYADIIGLESDFALMSHNARVYNLDSSYVYFDAEMLRSILYKCLLRDGFISHAELASDCEQITVTGQVLGIMPRIPNSETYAAYPKGAPPVRHK